MTAGAGRPPRVVGHRGAAAKAPENTAASFRAALEARADAIELDVGRTKDGHVVVHHDATLDRTTSGHGRLADRTWLELSALDAGSWFSRRFAGEHLLDLDGALALVRGRVPVIVELKAHRRAGRGAAHPDDLVLLEGVLAALRRHERTGNVAVSSSCWPLLAAAAERAPRLPLALTVPRWRRGDPVAAARDIGARALHPDRRLCTPRFMARAHAAGLEVIAYVVNRSRELDALIAAGADGIFTDDPEAMRQLVARRFARGSPRDAR
jgi:glycerophosphoryl diester phosphodiesterase